MAYSPSTCPDPMNVPYTQGYEVSGTTTYGNAQYAALASEQKKAASNSLQDIAAQQKLGYLKEAAQAGLGGANSQTGGAITGGINTQYPPITKGKCPCCGYCPHCGRTNQTFPSHPYPTWTMGGVTGTTIANAQYLNTQQGN